MSSRKQVRVTNTPYTPLLYSKTGVYRGILFFLIFAPKHRLWVLVRTINVLSKNKKNIKNFHLKMNIFTAVKYCCILHGHVFVMFCDCFARTLVEQQCLTCLNFCVYCL